MTLGAWLLQHAIVFVICIVFPGVVTAMAPASWLSFHRSDQKLSCTARTCVFFVVPYQTQFIDRVNGISQHEQAGQTKRERKAGRDTNKLIRVDGNGYLEIQGENGQVAEVSVSPASLESTVAKANAILNSVEPGTHRIFVVANWKFGVLMGGILSLFTLLYVVGYTCELIKRVANAVRQSLKRAVPLG